LQQKSRAFGQFKQAKRFFDLRQQPGVAQQDGQQNTRLGRPDRGFRQGTVFLEMQGACSGCPSSTMTLKMGIESLLKYYVPEVLDVRAV